MSLIRGSTSKRPCPICTVGADELADITRTWPPRTAAFTQELVAQAHKLKATECENLLSEHGICNVEVSTFDHLCMAVLISNLW
jgi:hypothetical protein